MSRAVAKNLHIPSLDGIRAIAAMMVFISHAGQREIVPGLFGVTIFFFLSGYLITTLIRMEFESTGTVSLKNFYLRRIYRIFPPMYIVLLIMALLAIYGVVLSEMTLTGLFAQFAHLTNYYEIFNGGTGIAPDTGAMWSLAVEEHFYLVFPVAVLFLMRRVSLERTALYLAGFCLIVLAWRCVLVFGLDMSETYTRAATDTRLDSILFGCIMGLWRNPALDADADRIGAKGWAVLLGVGTTFLLLSFLIRDAGFRETFRYTLQGVALFPVFYCAVRFSHWPMFRWMENKWIRRLGLISYTFYLSHQAALEQAERFFPNSNWTIFFVALAVTLAFSTAMYFLVEKRMGVLRRKLHSV